MAFELKMSFEVSRSLTSSSGKLQSTMGSSLSISPLGEYPGLVAEAVGRAEEGDIRDQGSHARFRSAWRRYPCADREDWCPCRDSSSACARETRSCETEDLNLVPAVDVGGEAEDCLNHLS